MSLRGRLAPIHVPAVIYLDQELSPRPWAVRVGQHVAAREPSFSPGGSTWTFESCPAAGGVIETTSPAFECPGCGQTILDERWALAEGRST